MFTPHLADRPPKLGKISPSEKVHRYVVFWYVMHVAAIISLIVSDHIPKHNVAGNTNFIYGWVHGYYLIPEYLASLMSDKLTIYQMGGGAWYNTGYLMGLFFMYHGIKAVFKYRRDALS